MVPSPVIHGSARVLEFESLREMLGAYISSDLGRAHLAGLAPSTDRAWIGRQQQLAAEIREFLRSGGRFDFSGLTDPKRLVDKSRIEGAALEPAEIRDLLAVVDRAAEWLEIVLHPPTDMPAWPAVAELSSVIADFTDFLRFFRNKILPDGTLDDRASPALGQIRREIEKQKRAIQESLRGYLRRLGESGAVQEELVTIRGERFVIPVKSEQKRRVNGVVHGVSSSGQTVFVEPLETIEQNNDLIKLLEDEQVEIHRILLEMSRRIAEVGAPVLTAADALAELELQFAKARFANEYQCCPVTLTENKLLLENARHPLLERNLRPKRVRVVPVTVELETTNAGPAGETGAPSKPSVGLLGWETPALQAGAESCHELIITGPNTGGKTVSLKTVGLLSLMAQSGLPVPCERAELPVFDAVLADIGDYQSIEQNLSTFSAHVTNIDMISRTATPHSLVLLDELGSATDPEEGAALAVAIAEHFRRIGAMTIISTHHTSLKVYAANTPGTINAAVGFDEHTLQPTYELRVGVPGASAGINIAQRLGLNPAIIEAARARLSSQTQDVARFLDKLHAELRQAEQDRFRMQTREVELKRERERLEQHGLREQRDKIRELEGKLDSLMKDFEYHMREAVHAVQDRAAAMKLSKEAERRIAKARREFREQFNQAVVAHKTGADVGDVHAQPQVVKHVSEGDTVKLKSVGRSGRVLRRLDDDAFEVEIGSMKMRIPRDDIAEVIGRTANNPVQAARARGISVSLAHDEAAASEINVIGHTVDQATSEVEKFVDRAFLAGLTRVRVVHGSGMGILRKALRQFLQQHPHVAVVSEPPQNEGGGGATIVELRS